MKNLETKNKLGKFGERQDKTKQNTKEDRKLTDRISKHTTENLKCTRSVIITIK
jgi:hypothetical protein